MHLFLTTYLRHHTANLHSILSALLNSLVSNWHFYTSLYFLWVFMSLWGFPLIIKVLLKKSLCWTFQVHFMKNLKLFSSDGRVNAISQYQKVSTIFNTKGISSWTYEKGGMLTKYVHSHMKCVVELDTAAKPMLY